MKVNRATLAVRGIGAQVRVDGFSWRVRVRDLGPSGKDYYRFDGDWRLVLYSSLPRAVQQALRAKIRAAITMSLCQTIRRTQRAS